MSFNPNETTYDQGIQAIERACKEGGLDIQKEIITSQDAIVKKVIKALNVTNVPSGFFKYQLPIHFNCATQTYMSFGSPLTKVPLHSHNEGPGLRVIMFGSIVYNNQELKSGDWMYIPKGKEYEFEVGTMGVGFFYCYCCSCR